MPIVTSRFCTSLANGRVPQDLAHLFVGARLIALKKPAGGVRPIAIGEMLRRLAGKTILRKTKDGIRGVLEPFQVGVGVSKATELVVHALRVWASSSSITKELIL